MANLREGEVVQARILAFLPGRRVVLDVAGETLLAWSRLPLVRGRVVSAVVESAGGGIRLRVLDEDTPQRTDALGETLARSGIRWDDLDLLITEAAIAFGLPVEERLLGETREHLRERNRTLETGAVPLLKLKREILSLLAARSRGLPATPRALAALNVDPEARLGTALSRLIDNLGSVVGDLGDNAKDALVQRAAGLRSMFVDLEAETLGEDLVGALARCGYFYEAKLRERGYSNWREVPGLEEEDLKGSLLSLWSWLSEVKDDSFLHRKVRVRRGLEKSLAWCGRSLDIIEGVQAQNLPCSGEPEPVAAFQVPVEWRSGLGTIFLLFSSRVSQLWLDLQGVEAFGADFLTRDGAQELVVRLPDTIGERARLGSPSWADSLAERLSSNSRNLSVSLADSETPRPSHHAGAGVAVGGIDLTL